MGRKVFISSDMCVDGRLAQIAAADGLTALLWPWLLTAFDDWGRAEADPWHLKAMLFPMNPTVSVEDIQRALALYADVGLITLYEVDGKRYLAMREASWWAYQTHLHRDRRAGAFSRYPGPPHQPPEASDYTTPADGDQDSGDLGYGALYEAGSPQQVRRAFGRIRRHVVPFLLRRGQYRCAICGARQDLEIDHIIPVARGGSNHPDNLQLLCQSCNRAKGPRQGGITS